MTKPSSTKATVKIRAMSEEDIDKVLAIDRKNTGSRRAPTYADPMDNYIGGDISSSWVAEAHGQLVGFILGRLSGLGARVPLTGIIELIGVDPDWKRQGIGVKLVEAFSQDCKQKGARQVSIIVVPQDEELRRFFKSLGFQTRELVHLESKL